MNARGMLVLLMVFAVAAFLPGCPKKAEVSLTVTTVTLEVGQSLALGASSTDANDAPFAWAIDNPAVAALDAASGLAVNVTAAAPGTATVTVTGAKSGATATAVISVPTPAPVEEEPAVVSITPISAMLEAGNVLPLNAASTDPADTDFTWTVSNGAVAALSAASGLSVDLTAVAAGVTTVTVTGVASGSTATAAFSVLADDGGTVSPVTPLVPAGLNIEVVGVAVPGDLKPEVTFTATNDRGDQIPFVELTEVRFMLAYLDPAPAEGTTARYISYNTRMENPDGVANNGDEALQATYDGAQLAGLSDNGDGTLKYKFRTAVPANYNPMITHAVGGQFRRTSALDGKVYKANAALEFRPDGGAVAETRDIVETATCNECHTRMEFHGEIRREVKLCILCHNPGSTDANTGNTVDMPVMIHKIHRGEQLPSVQAGDPYQIIGFGNTVHDYSTVAFPQDIRNCTACHKQDDKAAQADVYLTKPTRAGCGSCHDRTWFGDPAATPEGWENHSVEFAQEDDRLCAACHTPEAPGYSPIREAHLTPVQRPENPGLNLQITNVAVNPDDGTLTVDYSATYGDGSPVTDIADIQRIGVIVAWPAPEYETYKSEGIRGSRPAPGTVVNATSPTGEYSYVFAAKLPLDPGLTFGIAMTGRVAFTVDEEEHEAGLSDNSLQFFTIDGSEPQPRREVVDDAQCAKCHGGTIRFHGEQRLGVGVCVMCHNTNLGEFNFKDMLHKWHTGEELSAPFHGAEEVRFPGLRQECSICHGANSVDLPLAPEALPTVITNEDDSVTTILPERAACVSCHDSLMANIHASLNTDAGAGVETCAVCHGAGADFAVSAVHALEP